MFAQKLQNLPQSNIRRILILRTAPVPQVRLVVEQLRNTYPEAQFWVLGRQLNHSLFAGMRKFEITSPWLNSRGYRPFRRAAESAGFDLAVMCLNGDSWVGYEQVSRVMKRIPSTEKLVASYTMEWYAWQHEDFQEGPWAIRWASSVIEAVLLPLVYLGLIAMPSGKKYMPAGQGKSAPGYDR